MTHERASLLALERELGREIEIRARMELHQEQFEIASAGEGEPVSLPLPWLVDRKTERQLKEAARAAEMTAAATAAASRAPEAPPEAASEPQRAADAQPRREYLSMSLLDDEDDDALASEAPVRREEPSPEAPNLVDGQSESPILPRFREQEEGV
jgi:hypothetical protein